MNRDEKTFCLMILPLTFITVWLGAHITLHRWSLRVSSLLCTWVCMPYVLLLFFLLEAETSRRTMRLFGLCILRLLDLIHPSKSAVFPVSASRLHMSTAKSNWAPQELQSPPHDQAAAADLGHTREPHDRCSLLLSPGLPLLLVLRQAPPFDEHSRSDPGSDSVSISYL